MIPPASIPRISIPQPVKRLLPQSLFGRALLILVLPTVLIQLFATYMFYTRHWENVSRWMASSLAGEIALLAHELNDAGPISQQKLISVAEKLMRMRIRMEPEPKDEKFLRSGQQISPAFFGELETRLGMPFALSLTPNGEDLHLRVKLDHAVLVIEVTRKRLVSGTTTIFVMWMFGSATVLLGVAVIFLRNQIRPITRLATAMDGFGKGHDAAGFRPQGADEVRRAGNAFLLMKQRLERQISARMEMLAGISHDLRTPLTRMKLQLEMLKTSDSEGVDALRRDLADMEHMTHEYLDFVRGEGQESPQRLKLAEVVEDIIGRYQSTDAPLAFDRGEVGAIEVDIRPHVFRRALTNLIENALRYGEQCRITLKTTRNHAEIWVEDSGPGIPKEQHEAVFRPFTRLDQSRNVATGGVGLGLTIARDIIHAHGGDIILQNAEPKGLRVILRLPLVQ